MGGTKALCLGHTRDTFLLGSKPQGVKCGPNIFPISSRGTISVVVCPTWPSKQRESTYACQQLATLCPLPQYFGHDSFRVHLNGLLPPPPPSLQKRRQLYFCVITGIRVITIIPALVSVWVAITSRSFEARLGLSTRLGSDLFFISNVLYRFR